TRSSPRCCAPSPWCATSSTGRPPRTARTARTTPAATTPSAPGISIAVELPPTLAEPSAARPVHADAAGLFAVRPDDGALPDGVDRTFLEAQQSKKKPEQTYTVPDPNDRAIVLLELSPAEKIEIRTYRRTAAAFARAAHKQTHLTIDVLGSL